MTLQVRGAGEDIQRAAAQRTGVQGRVRQIADTNSDIRALLQQIDDQVVAVEFQLDIRVQLAKLGDIRHHCVQHEGRRGVDPQAPGRRALPQGQALFQLVHLLQDLLGPLEEKLALLGQVHASGGAIDQRGIELGFQPRQAATDRRRGLADLLSRR